MAAEKKFGELLYDVSLKGVQDGLATWVGNTVQWNHYEKFADVISYFQEMKFEDGSPVYAIQRSFVIDLKDIDHLRKSKDKKYTSFMLRNNFWPRYKLNSKNSDPSGTFELLADWGVLLSNPDNKEVGLAVNNLPFRYTIKHLVNGKKDNFLKTFEPFSVKIEDDSVYQNPSEDVEALKKELRVQNKEIDVLKSIITKQEATSAASLLEGKTSDERLDMVEFSIIQLTALLDSIVKK